MRPDESKRATAGVGAREGEGKGLTFRGAVLSAADGEIKARLRAALNPANAVMSARQPGRRWRWRRRAQGQERGRARVRRALALRSGSGPGSARLRSWLPSGSWHQLRAVT
ncbi:putative uncharacterized protein FLJ13197 [Meles meles]|uniref:putative uncharacterized protein FLJ13197 n=1 Tax=Meles meles TaxID=9662 RepID=UPI001E6A09E9|nr:putative uncharacterized protein FLJ13197 [Meles meles]